MKLVVEGVMGGSLPWTLVLAGAGIAVAIEIIGIPVPKNSRELIF